MQQLEDECWKGIEGNFPVPFFLDLDLDSLAIVMGTWGFSCLLEDQAVPFHPAVRDPGDSAFQVVLLNDAGSCRSCD